MQPARIGCAIKCGSQHICLLACRAPLGDRLQQLNKAPHHGRNAPCPRGPGKKFKHSHGLRMRVALSSQSSLRYPSLTCLLPVVKFSPNGIETRSRSWTKCRSARGSLASSSKSSTPRVLDRKRGLAGMAPDQLGRLSGCCLAAARTGRNSRSCRAIPARTHLCILIT